jgi:glycosyltransferase involved in cell wall biosynthesis
MVELMGFVAPGPDLRAAYRDAHVFIHTAVTEGVPQVLLEAQAHGVPIVATDVGGVSEVVTDNVNGLLVPPGRPRALADAVSRLVRDPEMARELASAGLEHVRNHTLESESERVAAFLSSHRA